MKGRTTDAKWWQYLTWPFGSGELKRCTRLATAKVYQLLAHGLWLSPGNPASSTTKPGRHDIAEILLRVALNTINQIMIYDFSHHWYWWFRYQNKYSFILYQLYQLRKLNPPSWLKSIFSIWNRKSNILSVPYWLFQFHY
jgi:hypothetical protein